MSTRCEVRMPDPACNPYLALAVMLAAGLDGVENDLPAGEPVNKNIFSMSQREKRRLKIAQLPANLSEALDNLERNRVMRAALGEHTFSHYLASKRQEWEEYISRVHPWEQERYLGEY
jgi:glutamine synthetase